MQMIRGQDYCVALAVSETARSVGSCYQDSIFYSEKEVTKAFFSVMLILRRIVGVQSTEQSAGII